MGAVLAVALGGAVGAVLRYWIGLGLNKPEFPYGTFVVNLVGSFLIGIVVLLATKKGWPDQTVLFVVTGVLGGFTTFSAFSLENLRMVQEGRIGAALAYGFGSVAVGLVLAWAGAECSSRLVR